MLYLLFAVSVLTTVGAHLCFKKGVLKLGEITLSFPEIFNTIWHIVQNAWILLGVVLFGISFLTWLFILSKLQLNVAYPIIISIEATLVTVASWLLFHEYLSILQIVGIVCVIIGIILIAPKGGL
ncbi:MAG: SMR family transporter [Candidatus Nealsonbacteria bacterium]